MEKAKKIITEGQRLREGMIEKLKPRNWGDYNYNVGEIGEKMNEIIDVLNGMPDFNPKRKPISGKNIVQKLNKKGGD